MNQPIPENLAKEHLSKFGISRKTLLQAASFFPEDSLESEDKNVESPQRGRPVYVGLKWGTFYLYAEYCKANEKLPTDNVLKNEIEKRRIKILEQYKLEGKLAPDEYRSPVKLTTVKSWRQEFDKLWIEKREDCEMQFNLLDTKRQKFDL